MGGEARLDALPPQVESALSAFLAAAQQALSNNLVSAILFGSAAEGRLGPTSDVNLLLVLREFAPEGLARMRDALLTAEAAIKLRVMLVRERELPQAAELFAQKFADIMRRHRTVVGAEVLASLKIPRPAEIFRLRQILLNLVLRLREAFFTRGHRPEQVARILADTLGPLRAVCATLLELEGRPASDSTAALSDIAQSLGLQSAATHLMTAHAGHTSEPADALLQVVTLAERVAHRAAQLS